MLTLTRSVLESIYLNDEKMQLVGVCKRNGVRLANLAYRASIFTAVEGHPIEIDDEITVKYTNSSGSNKANLSIGAPDDVRILRGEIYDTKKTEVAA